MKAFSPVYSTPAPNAPVQLFSGPVEIFSTGGRVAACTSADASFQWYPEPRVALDLSLEGVEYDDDDAGVTTLYGLGDDGTLHLPDGTIAPITLSYFSIGGERNYAEGMVRERGLKPSSTLDSATFHLVNFHHYLPHRDSFEPNTGAHVRHFDISLPTEEYLVDLDAALEYTWPHSNTDLLRVSGGYALTHFGRFTKVDGSKFTIAQAQDLIEALTYFFSFCRGHWSPLVLSVGFDAHGKREWEDWRGYLASPWEIGKSCFPCRSYEPESLAGALDAFLTFWKQPDWQPVLKTAIAWYIQANTTPSPETKAAMVQVGLELLAWVILVEQSGIISRDGYERLNASDCLRLVLHQASIPLAIPGSLSHLGAFAKANNITTGPEALTYLRNAVIHPTVKNIGRVNSMPMAARSEATSLALSYLELVLLYVLSYKGPYADRMKHRADDDWERPVPWQ
ncbi:hypothetical protein D3C72_728730 [compost metagenome]